MRVALHLARRDAFLPPHQRPLLLRLVILVRPRSILRPPFVLANTLGRHHILIHPIDAHLHPLPTRAPRTSTPTPTAARIHMHLAQRLTYAQKQLHEAFLGEFGVVDQIGVDQVLQVSSAVVRQQNVHRLGGLAAAALRGDRVVDAVDDARGVGEELVGVDLLHGLGDGLGAEGAADLFQGEELRGRGVLDKVDVGEAALLEGGCARR